MLDANGVTAGKHLGFRGTKATKQQDDLATESNYIFIIQKMVMLI